MPSGCLNTSGIEENIHEPSGCINTAPINLTRMLSDNLNKYTNMLCDDNNIQ